MAFEEHLGTALKAIWKKGNNMYATLSATMSITHNNNNNIYLKSNIQCT